MSDNYLWDRSGTPDPGIADLERALSPLRLPAGAAPRNRSPRIPLAVAASVLAAFAVSQTMLVAPPETAWQTGGETVHTGQVLRASGSEVQLDADGVGRVWLEAGAEAAIVESRPGRQRFDLRTGSMRALIWAPAREFVVDTPSVRAVDLGCQYTLSVDRQGDGALEVETGWVAFEHKGVESFIPAGARCRTRRGTGPGTPYFQDASGAFALALDEFDTRGSRGALEAVLAQARPRDGLSLWHLLARTSGRNRAAVFQQFARLVALPPQVTEARILHSDPAALDVCWNALGLDSASWWRSWRRTW